MSSPEITFPAKENELIRLRELLAEIDCDLLVYQEKILSTLVRDDIEVKVLHPEHLTPHFDSDLFTLHKDDDDISVLVTTAEHPVILFEDSASFCSLLISVDGEGNAVLLHQPLITITAKFMRIEDNEINEIFQKYQRALEKLGQERVNIVSGTNVSNHLRKKVQEKIKKFFGKAEKFLPLFTDSKLERLHPMYQGIRGMIRKIFVPDERSLTKKYFDGVVVVPKQLSKDGRTKVVLLTEKTSFVDYDIAESLSGTEV